MITNIAESSNYQILSPRLGFNQEEIQMMDQKPWYQKKKMDSAFPFTVSDCPIRNFTLHWHEPIEILYVSHGRMSASIEGHVFEAREGDIVVINSGFLHGISNVLGKDAMHFNFQFGLEIFDQALVDLRDRTAQKSVFDRQPFLPPSGTEICTGVSEPFCSGFGKNIMAPIRDSGWRSSQNYLN
jgi:mannose-6-phosphate isomerase-like protein (cupin superfamily)